MFGDIDMIWNDSRWYNNAMSKSKVGRSGVGRSGVGRSGVGRDGWCKYLLGYGQELIFLPLTLPLSLAPLHCSHTAGVAEKDLRQAGGEWRTCVEGLAERVGQGGEGVQRGVFVEWLGAGAGACGGGGGGGRGIDFSGDADSGSGGGVGECECCSGVSQYGEVREDLGMGEGG